MSTHRSQNTTQAQRHDPVTNPYVTLTQNEIDAGVRAIAYERRRYVRETATPDEDVVDGLNHLQYAWEQTEGE